MNAVDYNDGQSRIYPSSQKFVEVEIANKTGRAHVNWGLSWSPSNVGKMTLYTTDEGKSTPMNESRSKFSVAHELGHNMGLGDAYPIKWYDSLFNAREDSPREKVLEKDLMRVDLGTASVLDMIMIFQSHSTGDEQKFPEKK